MSDLKQNTNYLNNFEGAEKLREKAEVLKDKENVKQRLLKLIEISEDPYYDQYLNQMMKDLESGRATPFQVSREAERTYRLYQQRMGKTEEVQFSDNRNAVKEAETRQGQTERKDIVEFKVGAGIFSIVGAVFVLAAFVTFGFNFLEGIWQGICLYAASGVVVFLSELLIRKLNKRFSLVITGIGISCLYISTLINYLVLKNINGITASVIILLTGLFSVLLSKKKDTASIRMISFFGCYLCLLPIRRFDSELSFLIMTGILLTVNLFGVFLPAKRNQAAVSVVHMIAHTIFTGIMTGSVLSDGMNAMYVAFFLFTSLVLINIIYWKQKKEAGFLLTVIFSIALGFMTIFLVSTGCFAHGVDNGQLLLFYKLLTEVMAIVTAAVFFILLNRDRCRWIQYYFIAFVIIMFNGFSDYRLETTIGCLAIFILTRLLFKVEEVKVLDGILAVLTVLQGFYMCRTWYVIPFAVVLLFSAFMIRRKVIFHEIVLTVGFTFGILIQFDSNWTLPGIIAVLFLLFLLFNHLPALKNQYHLPYNIVNVIFAGFFCLFTVFCTEYYVNAVTMVIGAVMIITVFRPCYGLNLPKKYLLLAGFLVYMILASHYETSVIVSILLMIVAIGCVGVGFWVKDKIYRICGLVMAGLVCIKLVIYDFRELESLPKVILFLTVGMIALGISFLYIYLEKKEIQREPVSAEVEMSAAAAEKDPKIENINETAAAEEKKEEIQMQETQHEDTAQQEISKENAKGVEE